jgi:hypothetical protein
MALATSRVESLPPSPQPARRGGASPCRRGDRLPHNCRGGHACQVVALLRRLVGRDFARPAEFDRRSQSNVLDWY